jgi:inorganic triphosphatase YgiF
MTQEIEIKLAARPDELQRLAQNRILKPLIQGNAATRRYSTVYYDTPEFALAKSGVSLRVRRRGRSYVQSVKDRNIGALASERAEWEAPLPTHSPDLRYIPDPATRERLIALAGDESIEPKLETEIWRTTRLLKTEAGDEIEFAIDRGEIRTLVNGRETLPVSEVELELKRGSPAALYEIARGLSGQAHLTVSTESKAERGLRALEGRAIATFKAGRIALPPGSTAEDSFRATLLHCLRHIAQNIPAVVEARDVEGLHQLRVGLRRLRAALGVFGDAFRVPALDDLGARAKALAQEFGETRDLDVFATELFPLVEDAAPSRKGIAELRLHLDAMRAESWDRCAALGGSQRLTSFLLDLAAAAETRAWRHDAVPERILMFVRPAVDFAREALARRDRKARKRAKHLAALTTSERHRLRITLKKLRYAAEFFAPLFAAKDVASYLKKLSDAQDVFGALNDAATAEQIVDRILKHAPAASSELREGAAFVEGWHLSRIGPAWRDAKGNWKRLAKTDPFWSY